MTTMNRQSKNRRRLSAGLSAFRRIITWHGLRHGRPPYFMRHRNIVDDIRLAIWRRPVRPSVRPSVGRSVRPSVGLRARKSARGQKEALIGSAVYRRRSERRHRAAVKYHVTTDFLSFLSESGISQRVR